MGRPAWPGLRAIPGGGSTCEIVGSRPALCPCLLCVAAAAAELVMHKLAGRPVAIVRGYTPPLPGAAGTGRDLIIGPERDLFR